MRIAVACLLTFFLAGCTENMKTTTIVVDEQYIKSTATPAHPQDTAEAANGSIIIRISAIRSTQEYWLIETTITFDSRMQDSEGCARRLAQQFGHFASTWMEFFDKNGDLTTARPVFANDGTSVLSTEIGSEAPIIIYQLFNCYRFEDRSPTFVQFSQLGHDYMSRLARECSSPVRFIDLNDNRASPK